MRTEPKVEYRKFGCSRMGAPVNTTCRCLVLREGIGEIKRIRTGFDCDHKSDCGIGSAAGFDWSKCVCPDSRQ
jgi:hypothetical protein